MTERQAIEAIYQLWLDSWPTLRPTVPYTFANEIFESAASWARLSLIHTTSRQMTMGAAPSRRWERNGYVFVQLFAPPDAGRGALADLAEDVRVALEGKRALEINLYAAATNETPTDGAWAMTAVSVPFRYVQTR